MKIINMIEKKFIKVENLKTSKRCICLKKIRCVMQSKIEIFLKRKHSLKIELSIFNREILKEFVEKIRYTIKN